MQKGVPALASGTWTNAHDRPWATYLPVVFVMEEVLFRGLIDTYLHGSTPGPDRASALYGPRFGDSGIFQWHFSRSGS
jgi:hypothetical protein